MDKDDLEKILVLGASGFIGSHTSSYLKKNNLVLTPPRAELDLSNTIAINTYIRENQPDTIVNCSWLPFGLNVPLVKRLIKSDAYLINIGSGIEKTLYSEKWREYAKEKIAIAKLLEGKRTVNLRCYGVYGIRDSFPMRFIPSNTELYKKEREISVTNTGKFDYINVGDLARVIGEVIRKKPLGDFDAIQRERHSLPEIGEMIVKIFGGITRPNQYARNQDYIGDGRKLWKFLGKGFRFISMENGLKQIKNKNESLHCPKCKKAITREQFFIILYQKTGEYDITCVECKHTFKITIKKGGDFNGGNSSISIQHS